MLSLFADQRSIDRLDNTFSNPGLHHMNRATDIEVFGPANDSSDGGNFCRILSSISWFFLYKLCV